VFKATAKSKLNSRAIAKRERMTAKPYRTKPLPMGLKKGFSYDNIGELLARIEGEHYR
jgi:hypothetical protein